MKVTQIVLILLQSLCFQQEFQKSLSAFPQFCQTRLLTSYMPVLPYCPELHQSWPDEPVTDVELLRQYTELDEEFQKRQILSLPPLSFEDLWLRNRASRI